MKHPSSVTVTKTLKPFDETFLIQYYPFFEIVAFIEQKVE